MATLTTYNTYKPSGIDWIGDIPSHWKLKKLKYNTYVKARVGWHGLNSEEFFFGDGGAYCVTGTDFKLGTVDWKTCYKVLLERYEEDKFIQLRENDLLITKDGTIGKTAVVRGLAGEATLNSGVFVVRPTNEEYTTDFLYWVLKSSVFTGFVNFTSKGSTIIHLYQDVFINLQNALPPLSEQAAIARYLDEQTTQLDALIDRKRRLINLLREEKTALINEAVTKGINPGVPMKDSGIEWLGEIPVHWEVKKLKYVLNSVNGGGTPSTGNPEFWKGNIPWVSPKDMKVFKISETEDYVTDLALTNSSTSLIQSNQVLMVVRSGILKHTLPVAVNMIPVTLNQDMKAFDANEKLSNEYLFWLFRGYANKILVFCNKIGATVDSIEMDDLLNFYIRLVASLIVN